MSSRRNIGKLQDVVDWNLCVGCGICYAVCPTGAITLKNQVDRGIVPEIDKSICARCNDCLEICPGNVVDAGDRLTGDDDPLGPAIIVYQGNATDPEIRFTASSGGIVSALALYCLEHEGMKQVIQVGADPAQPLLNRTYRSNSKQDVIKNCGSRYAPASPCEALRDECSDDGAPFVFIGKPCDICAAKAMGTKKPRLLHQMGLTISLCCAGAPSMRGTLDLLDKLDVPYDDVNSIRYRGRGWPGKFAVQYAQNLAEKELSYDKAWGRLCQYRSLRCLCCPDGFGIFADIACGDAWHFATEAGDKGSDGCSIAVVRTEKGRAVIEGAARAGYIQLVEVSKQEVAMGQAHLVGKQQQLFGRLLALRLFCVPMTTFRGFGLFQKWFRLSSSFKARSIIGTVVRIMRRKLWRRHKVGQRSSETYVYHAK